MEIQLNTIPAKKYGGLINASKILQRQCFLIYCLHIIKKTGFFEGRWLAIFKNNMEKRSALSLKNKR